MEKHADRLAQNSLAKMVARLFRKRKFIKSHIETPKEIVEVAYKVKEQDRQMKAPKKPKGVKMTKLMHIQLPNGKIIKVAAEKKKKAKLPPLSKDLLGAALRGGTFGAALGGTLGAATARKRLGSLPRRVLGGVVIGGLGGAGLDVMGTLGARALARRYPSLIRKGYRTG
jgi:hypothetical protein